jgi:IclR family transcriptional regulator, KDG regulon repressor
MGVPRLEPVIAHWAEAGQIAVRYLDRRSTEVYDPTEMTETPTAASESAYVAGDARRASSTGVHTTLRVLELLVARAPLTLAELARELGVAKSTVHRVCSILVERAWAIRRDDGRYELGIRALAAGSVASRLPIVLAFRSVAASLLTRHDETVCLTAIDGEDAVFVAIEETSHQVRLVTHVGSRTPAFASAGGRVILAARAPSHIVGSYGGRPLVTPTGRRLSGIAELQSILEGVRTDGFAESDGETASGLYAVAVPVRNASGTVLAALTLCVPTSRMTPDRRSVLIGDLIDAGERLSELVAPFPPFVIGDDVRDASQLGGT